MKTTDYGFFRVILCIKGLWKEVLIGALAIFAYVLVSALVVFCMSLFIDLIGLQGDLLRAEYFGKPSSPHRQVDVDVAEFLLRTGAIVLLFLALGAISCTETKTIRVTRTKLLVQRHHSARRKHSVQVYELSDLRARRGWKFWNRVGIIIDVKDRYVPVCFVLDCDRANEVIRHINQRGGSGLTNSRSS